MIHAASLARSKPVIGYATLFAAIYGAYGALSPFLPAYLAERGLDARDIAAFLAAATATRLVAGPLAGWLADRTGRPRAVLVVSLALACACNLALLAGQGFGPLLALGLAQAVATAPLAPLADALALTAARGGRAFEYGWVRAAGSTAFIAASILTGFLVDRWGNGTGLWACGAAFALASVTATRVDASSRPPPRSERAGVAPPAASLAKELVALFANTRFRRTVLAAALVIGAHAVHDAFGVIAWREAGISSVAAGLLWSESVAAEVVVFLWIGPRLLARLGPACVLALAALAGALRWTVQGSTSWLPALSGIQCLHGLTFAALHLACLALIEDGVPARLRATALALYGSVGLGLASALLTLAAGELYATVGVRAFWAMSVLSLSAIPLALSLRARN